LVKANDTLIIKINPRVTREVRFIFLLFHFAS